MNIKDLRWSDHITIERQERTLAILMTVGFGEIYKIKDDFYKGRQRIFTDTGCILITRGREVITAFVANYDQMEEFFDGQVPHKIRKAVKHSRNMIAKYEGTV